MSLDCDFQIGDRVVYRVAEKPEDRVHGVVVDVGYGEELCGEEDYDEDDHICDFEHDNWYIKVLVDGDVEETDWNDEYYYDKESDE